MKHRLCISARLFYPLENQIARGLEGNTILKIRCHIIVAWIDHEVRIGGTLYSDAMGRKGTYAGEYLGMFDHNITTIIRALGGSAPLRGFGGQLAQKKGM